MLAFYDPDAALQMDAEIFPSLHMGNTEMLPVCAADAEGKPLFDLEGEGSVPLLAYSAGAFLGRSVNLLLRQRNLRFTTVYETAMADSRGTQAMPRPSSAMLLRLSAMAVSYTEVKRRLRWRSSRLTERPRNAPAL